MQASLDKMYQQGDLQSATPQRLQYLLVDGAIRFAKQASQHWLAKDFEQGGEAMDRCEAILAEILKNIRIGDGAVADRIASLYLFLWTSATESHFRHDTERLGKVISILETERETWRVLCETIIMGKMSPAVESDGEEHRRHDKTNGAPISTQTDHSSFSLEA